MGMASWRLAEVSWDVPVLLCYLVMGEELLDLMAGRMLAGEQLLSSKSCRGSFARYDMRETGGW